MKKYIIYEKQNIQMNMFIHILDDVTSYTALGRMLYNESKYHYKYINQVFNK